MPRTTVLVVDDDKNTLQSLDFILTAAGFDVLTATDGQSALARIRSGIGTPGSVRLLITDIQIPGHSGLELIDEIHRMRIGLPVLVITAYRDRHLEDELQSRGCTEVLDKPLDEERLIGRVKRSVARADPLAQSQR